MSRLPALIIAVSVLLAACSTDADSTDAVVDADGRDEALSGLVDDAFDGAISEEDELECLGTKLFAASASELDAENIDADDIGKAETFDDLVEVDSDLSKKIQEAFAECTDPLSVIGLDVLADEGDDDTADCLRDTLGEGELAAVVAATFIGASADSGLDEEIEEGLFQAFTECLDLEGMIDDETLNESDGDTDGSDGPDSDSSTSTVKSSSDKDDSDEDDSSTSTSDDNDRDDDDEDDEPARTTTTRRSTGSNGGSNSGSSSN